MRAEPAPALLTDSLSPLLDAGGWLVVSILFC